MAINDIAAHIYSVLRYVPASPQRMRDIRDHTVTDPQFQVVRQFIQSCWPDYESKIPVTVRDFYQLRGELSEIDGLVVRGNHIVAPTSIRKEIVERIYDDHQGLVKCKESANHSVWWLRISQAIVTKVKQCRFELRAEAHRGKSH